MTFVQKLEREMWEREREHFAARREYRQWLIDNDCTTVIPTYWHRRAMAATRQGLPTYHSRLGRVTIPENES